MQIQDQLRELGLNKAEIGVYLYLLEQGVSTPTQIARRVHITRTNSYPILRRLKERGLVEKQMLAKKQAFAASDPQAILNSIQKRKTIAEQLVPDLRALYKGQKNKPVIKFYDGLEQIKQVYIQTLEAKEIYAIASTDILFEKLPDFIFHNYHRQLKQRKIFFHNILTQKSASYDNIVKSSKGLIDRTLLPEKYGNFPIDLLIWDDKVAFVVLEEPYFGTIIQSESLAKTFKIIWKIINDYLHED